MVVGVVVWYLGWEQHRSIQVKYYTDVKNAVALRAVIDAKKMECAVIDASLVSVKYSSKGATQKAFWKVRRIASHSNFKAVSGITITAMHRLCVSSA